MDRELDRDFVTFLQWALPQMGMRWRGFRRVRRQVIRRIRARMAAIGVRDLVEYRALLDHDAREWRALDRCCFVTISRFFRDRRVFESLAEVFEAHNRPVAAGPYNAWSAGCASGEEPYSIVLAWSLLARRPVEQLSVLATDLDPNVLERARVGVYEASSLRELSPTVRDAGFERRGEQFSIRAWARGPVRFVQHDVRDEPPAGPFDLIACRNLAFTYFDDAGQARVLGRLSSALRPGGTIAVGTHEHLPGVADP